MRKFAVPLAGLALVAIAGCTATAAPAATTRPAATQTAVADHSTPAATGVNQNGNGQNPGSDNGFKAGTCITFANGSEQVTPCSSGGGYYQIVAVLSPSGSGSQDLANCRAVPKFAAAPTGEALRSFKGPVYCLAYVPRGST
jgi:hypothetical protein